jgi:nitrate reductase beta subunit
MQDLFNFPKNEVIKTNEKLSAKASKKSDTKDLRQTKRDDNFTALMKDFGGLPSENKYFAIKTNGTSDCGSIFSYILKEWEEITEMYLATWTISKQNIKRIEEAVLTGKLKSLTLVFSSTLKPANPALYASLVGSLKNFENVKLKEINSHAKTFSVTNGKDFITVSGSANWSENPRIENFLILNDKNLFEHHKEWMSELTDLV